MHHTHLSIVLIVIYIYTLYTFLVDIVRFKLGYKPHYRYLLETQLQEDGATVLPSSLPAALEALEANR
jgi:hypothetical protein